MYIEKIKNLTLTSRDVYLIEIIAANNAKIKVIEELNASYIRPSFVNETIFENTINSNEIEGITSKSVSRDKELFSGQQPLDENEKLIVNYKKTVEYIFNEYSNIHISKKSLLNIHWRLYEGFDLDFIGKLTGNNRVVSTKGSESITLFSGSSKENVEVDINNLFDHFNDLYNSNEINKLTLNIVFIAEFLSIHPLRDGNGRVSRLFTELILLKSGYSFIKYSSVDKDININKKGYYGALGQRNEDWNNKRYNVNSMAPFISYMLETLAKVSIKAHDKIMMQVNAKRTDIYKKIKELIESYPVDKTFSKQDVKLSLPFKVSDVYLSNSLTKLMNSNKIARSGEKKATKYKKLPEGN